MSPPDEKHEIKSEPTDLQISSLFSEKQRFDSPVLLPADFAKLKIGFSEAGTPPFTAVTFSLEELVRYRSFTADLKLFWF